MGRRRLRIGERGKGCTQLWRAGHGPHAAPHAASLGPSWSAHYPDSAINELRAKLRGRHEQRRPRRPFRAWEPVRVAAAKEERLAARNAVEP